MQYYCKLHNIATPVDGSPTIDEKPSLAKDNTIVHALYAYQYTKGFFLSKFETFS